MLQPPAVPGAFPGGAEAGSHILCSDSSTVGEQSVADIEGVGLHIRGNIVAFAEHRADPVAPVQGEQALVQQRKQYPVSVAHAGIGIQSRLRIIQQGNLPAVIGGRCYHRMVGKPVCQAVAGGHIDGLLFPAATQQAQRQSGAKKQRYELFHGRTSLQTMMAP